MSVVRQALFRNLDENIILKLHTENDKTLFDKQLRFIYTYPLHKLNFHQEFSMAKLYIFFRLPSLPDASSPYD